MASKHNKNKTEQPVFLRIKLPKGNEVIGIVEQRVGANRMIVKCLDGHQRNCRIPGSKRKRLWIRPNDVVIVKPWEFEGDQRGDLLFKYRPAGIEFLKKKGFLKENINEF